MEYSDATQWSTCQIGCALKMVWILPQTLQIFKGTSLKYKMSGKLEKQGI